MNIEEFNEAYAAFKDADKIQINCDHPKHNPSGELITIGKQPAKRNILKNGGEQFICRNCCMKYDNPMNKVGQGRQTDEEIVVYCHHPEHRGDPARKMKKACFYGKIQEPYLQVCGSCAQLGKQITEEQKEKIRLALTGIKRSDEFKQKLSEYMKNNPEGVARGIKNLLTNHCTTGMLGKKLSDEAKQKMSEAHAGKKLTEEHKNNIAVGRKKMLAEQGGFTRKHRENISKATIKQYQNGFEPKLHHLKGWHESPKAGKVYYRSSYEKKAFLKLDEDESVISYKYEAIEVNYWNPQKQITSSYLVDICVEYEDGSIKWIEVKPACWLTDDVIITKIEAAELKAKDEGVSFEVWSEIDLFGHVYNQKNIKLFVEKLKAGRV